MVKSLKNLFNFKWVFGFVAGLLVNLLLITTVLSVGIVYGFDGELGWNWDSYGTTWAMLFGDGTSLLWLLLGVAIILASAWLTNYLSKKGYRKLLIIWLFVAVVVLGFILYRLVDWSSFGFGFVPLLIFLVFTALEVTGFKLLFRGRKLTPARLASSS